MASKQHAHDNSHATQVTESANMVKPSCLMARAQDVMASRMLELLRCALEFW